MRMMSPLNIQLLRISRDPGDRGRLERTSREVGVSVSAQSRRRFRKCSVLRKRMPGSLCMEWLSRMREWPGYSIFLQGWSSDFDV